MKLSELLTNIPTCPILLESEKDSVISGIVHHCAHVEKNYVYVALSGSATHGNVYINDAIDNGAVCIITDTAIDIEQSIPIIVIPAIKESLSTLAERMYPCAHSKKLIGITGTNGKTTTASFISQALSSLGAPNLVIGTLTHERTTPDIFTLYKALHNSDAEYAVIEVSSHALVQERTKGLEFERVIWTNLSHEHLDYHGSMQKYLKAKLLLLKQAKYGIFNADDEYFDAFASRLEHTLYSLDSLEHSVRPFGFLCTLEHTIFEVNFLGEHNLCNLLAAYHTLISLGYQTLESIQALSLVITPKGRLERIAIPDSKLSTEAYIYVDYAHTPDALEHSLRTLTKHTGKEVSLVFGCGGDRDASKRDKMGKVASRLASRIILTNDNPRSESPEEIANDIAIGISNPHEVMLDRELAIAAAVEDKYTHVVLIAGKGHEECQIIGDTTHAFSDSATILKYL